MKSIGGEIELNLLNRSSNNGEFIMEDVITYFDSGRSALISLLKSIDVKRILLPDFFCVSILDVFEYLNIDYNFYNVDKNLRIVESSILKKIHDFDAVFIINYFGWSLNSEEKGIINNIKNNGLIVIEDWSHYSFVPYFYGLYNCVGDHVFGSLRKLFPVVDGGFILNINNLYNNKKKYQNGLFYSYKLLGKFLRELYLNDSFTNPAIENIYLELLSKGEEELDKKFKVNEISSLSYEILNELNYKKIFEIRRENFLFLKNLLEGNEYLRRTFEIMYSGLDNDTFPYYLSIKVNNNKRNLLREKLKEYGIFAAIIWKIPERFYNRVSENSKLLSEKLLCLPIDQRYTKVHMEKIYHSLIETCKKI